jgi:Tfp pilus assembly pilus retraction ATPase PilT
MGFDLYSVRKLVIFGKSAAIASLINNPIIVEKKNKITALNDFLDFILKSAKFIIK